jgi:hypothetical protein
LQATSALGPDQQAKARVERQQCEMRAELSATGIFGEAEGNQHIQ